jgi:hypothetical protein
VEAESKHMQNRNLDLSINTSAQISIHTVDQQKHIGREIDTHQNKCHLELSLRRFEYQAPLYEQKEIEVRNKRLNHSNSSPFSLLVCFFFTFFS